MGIPIDELQTRISSRRFAEYWAHFQLEPWGAEREDLRSGIVASTIANVNRDPKKRARAFPPDQFMPDPHELGRREDEDEEVDETEALEHAGRVDELMASLGTEAEPDAFRVRRDELAT